MDKTIEELNAMIREKDEDIDKFEDSRLDQKKDIEDLNHSL